VHAQPCIQGSGDAACLLCMLGAVIMTMKMICTCGGFACQVLYSFLHAEGLPAAVTDSST
jgi:hypothetical protein